MTAPALAFRWDGEAFHPLRPKAADAHYVVDMVYWLEPASDRSWISHAHQFAWLAEAWRNLPENLAGLYPTPEHLRKRALIDTGWFHEVIVDAGSEAAAERVAAYARGDDPFALVVVDGPHVIIRKARSQAKSGPHRMSRADFQASKSDIMTRIAELVGVDPEAFQAA